MIELMSECQATNDGGQLLFTKVFFFKYRAKNDRFCTKAIVFDLDISPSETFIKTQVETGENVQMIFVLFIEKLMI